MKGYISMNNTPFTNHDKQENSPQRATVETDKAIRLKHANERRETDASIAAIGGRSWGISSSSNASTVGPPQDSPVNEAIPDEKENP